MTRRQYIARLLRQIYGDYPSEDSVITYNYINNILGDAIAVAAETNYTDSLKIDGVAYINNSFYTTFKGIELVTDEALTWRITLPEIPVGIGGNLGISTIKLKDDKGRLSYPVVLLTQNQASFHRGMREIPNTLLGIPEGQYVYIESTLILSDYTASVTMVSGGDSTNLDSTLNVPPNYFKVMDGYIQKQLLLFRNMPQDVTADGRDDKSAIT